MNSIKQKEAHNERRVRSWPSYLVLLGPFKIQLIFAVVAMFFDAVLTVFRPWPLKIVIDRVLSHHHTRVPWIGNWLNTTNLDRHDILYGACAATLLIALSTGLLTYWYTRVLGDIGQRLVFDLRSRLFAQLQRLSLRFHDSHRRGDLVVRLTSDISSIQDIIANGILVLGSNAFLLVGITTIMFWLNWKFALVSLVGSPLLFWAVVRYTHRIKIAAREARVRTGLLASLAQETLASIRIVQGLAQEDQQSERFQVQSAIGLQSYLEGIRYQARVAPLVDMFAAIGLATVMWFGAEEVLAGRLTTGDMIIFFAYITNLYSPMRGLARLSYMTSKASIASERIAYVMRFQSDVVDRLDAKALLSGRGLIEFRDVSFEYKHGRKVLSGVTLRINPGEKVALVGATGAGKSTLVSLVPRFYDPTAGSIWIDGEDIRQYTLQSLRAQISLVLQDSLLFSGTIRENIAFGCPRATQREIEEAAIIANATEFIDRLPERYETVVAESGNTLSGGQKQRLAIARAVLRSSPILILDEPTSGLDAASERVVIDALERAARGRTTIFITHRLTTVSLADRIIVVDKGRIVEEGTREELLARNGQFARLYLLQTKSDQEDGFDLCSDRSLVTEVTHGTVGNVV